ncbi:hypothetical protein RHMOL_Rhmol08G0303800 [Rhododendron molle]|uniref:Uncharacterized protein n=1 Tax=Rhododendron molle TaxID=49168 RepID=A0ACC0MVA5_RHOML|nr:hypothetical protein RHMOL_Rhmol08G0303800 [Rhododendron molle]
MSTKFRSPKNMELTLFFFLTSVLATSQAAATPHQIHLLRPQSGASGHHVPGISCLSWRLAVETDNIRDWDVVPEACENYVGHYMLGHQYRKDCNAVGYSALQYAKSLKLAGDGKDIWVFDIDETALSNLPYYARPENGFGANEYNATSFNEWIEEGIAPPVPAVLKLYQKLLPLGFKIVFISGTSEKYRKIKISNLKLAGYHTWEKLILKPGITLYPPSVIVAFTASEIWKLVIVNAAGCHQLPQPPETVLLCQIMIKLRVCVHRATLESGSTALVYKSAKRKELVEAGYRILGNIGDQWSDLFGTYVGNRTFKVPDPMYYIS